MRIYWIEDKKKHGPASVPEIISRVQMGELSPDTKAWHKGCEQWMPLKELPALADCAAQLLSLSKGQVATDEQIEQLPPIPELPPVPTVQPMSSQADFRFNPQTGTINTPDGEIRIAPAWARFVARMVDCTLYASLAMALIYAFKLPFNEYLLPSGPTFWLPMIILEALLLNNFGTTPGKKLMGIRVLSIDGDTKLGFGRALSRCFSVTVLGMGCFLFPFNIIMMIVAFFMHRRRGITLWDARAYTLPVQRTERATSGIVLAAVSLFIGIQLIGYFMQPWLPTMIERIGEASPELAEKLNKLTPENSKAGK